MSDQRWRLGVLGGAAGGSLVTGPAWTSLADAIRTAVESDAVALGVTAASSVFIDSPTVSHALSWLLILGILYFHAAHVFGGRATILTDRVAFRLLLAGNAGAFAYLFQEFGGSERLLIHLSLGAVSIVSFLGYLKYSEIDVLDPNSAIFRYSSRMGQADTEAELRKYEQTTGWRREFRAFGFYLAPATGFMGVSFVLSLVIFALLSLYPIPELAVIVATGLALVNRAELLSTTGRLRARLDIEHRITAPLSHATSTGPGMLLTMFCLSGLVISSALLTIPLAVLSSQPSTTVVSVIDVFVMFASHDSFLSGLRLLVLYGLLLATLGMIPLSIAVWALTCILFWIRAIQRLPAVVKSTPAADDSSDDGTSGGPPSPPTRIPGALIPANGLAFASLVLLVVVFDRQWSIRLAPAEFLTIRYGAVFAGFFLATIVLIWLCLQAIRDAWTDATPQPTDNEEAVLSVAFLGMTLTPIVSLVFTPETSFVDSELAAATLSVVGLVVALVWLPMFDPDGTLPVKVERVSDEAVFAGLTFGTIVILSTISHLYYTSATPELPLILLGVGVLMVAFIFADRMI